MTDTREPLPRAVMQLVIAGFFTAGLLIFLVGMRLIRESDAPLIELRSLDTAEAVALPAPPPPPELTPPPPPPPPDLPRLQIELNSVAPPLRASLERKVELRLDRTEFAPEQQAPLEKMTFSASDLDAKPRLLNRPPVTFPSAQRKAGVKEAKVVLEILISATGSVEVKRIIECPHEDFAEVAKSYATRARFSPPKKDGRNVQALFRWPLFLKS